MQKPATIPQHWFSIFNAYENIFIALSGGLDSTVLLHFLSQDWGLSAKIRSIHVNHGLHADAEQWATHCQLLCQSYNIPCNIEKINIQGQGNIEEKARTARYAALQKYTSETACLLTAHHQDDQAETVLLNLMRGAGVSGLCAMPASKPFGNGVLYRPLLQVSRQGLLDYAKAHDLRWIDDPANQNLHFSRNFMRHDILPLLQKRWDASKMLAKTSELAQEAQNNLNDLAMIDYPEVINQDNRLPLTPIMHLSASRIKNVIRFWFKKHNLRPLNQITWHRLYHELIHANRDANPSIEWDDYLIRRFQQALYLVKNQSLILPEGLAWHSFPQPLKIPDIGILRAENSAQGVSIAPHQQIDIRFRRGGEAFYWHRQHQSLKKLMQLWQIPPWERARIPLLYVDGQLTSVIGYAVTEQAAMPAQEKFVISFLHNNTVPECSAP